MYHSWSIKNIYSKFPFMYNWSIKNIYSKIFFYIQLEQKKYLFKIPFCIQLKLKNIYSEIFFCEQLEHKYLFIQKSSLAGAYIKLNGGQLCSPPQPRIKSASTCEAAAKELGLVWGSTYSDAHGTPGCVFVNDGASNVQFNTHEAATKAKAQHAEICKSKSA